MTNVTTLPIADSKYILFTFENSKGEPCAKVQTVRGRVLWQYKFQSPENRDKYAVTQCEQLEQNEQKRAEYKQAAKERQSEVIAALKVGDIFYTSWGYDQTNIEFFKIVKISGKRITVKELRQRATQTGRDCGDCIPDSFFTKDAKEIILGVCHHGGFSIEGHYAAIWDGKPKMYTSGH